MTDARHVPCNLLTWPKLADLLPDQKLIYAYLWFNRFARSCGCYPFPVALAATELSLSPPSVLEALREFVRRELVAMVESTGEIFVLDWFRFNTFPPGPRQRVLAADLQRIESPDLKALVEKSISCVPREGKEREGKKTTTTSRSVDNFLQTAGTPPGSCNHVDLVFPPKLFDEERIQIEQMLGACPPRHRQDVLDELEGAIRRDVIQKGPVPFARSLVMAVKSGTFQPSLGVAVLASRRAAKRQAARVTHAIQPDAIVDNESFRKGKTFLMQVRARANQKKNSSEI